MVTLSTLLLQLFDIAVTIDRLTSGSRALIICLEVHVIIVWVQFALVSCGYTCYEYGNYICLRLKTQSKISKSRG